MISWTCIVRTHKHTLSYNCTYLQTNMHMYIYSQSPSVVKKMFNTHMNSSRRCIYSRLVGYQTQHQDCKTASLLKKVCADFRWLRFWEYVGSSKCYLSVTFSSFSINCAAYGCLKNPLCCRYRHFQQLIKLSKYGRNKCRTRRLPSID